MKSSIRSLLKTVSAIVVTVVLVPTPRVQAQSISDLIKSLGVESVARDYLRPGADAVGYSLNSGLYNTARVSSGFHFSVGVRGMWTFIPENDQTFVTVLPKSMTDLGYRPVTTATITGKTGATLTTPNMNYPSIKLPDGIDQNSAFFMLPQASIGTVLGTELFIRGIPKTTFETNIGKVSFFGVGLKHSPTSYIRLPVDVAVMAAVQRFTIADIMTVTSESFHVIGSIPLGLFTAYGGMGYEAYAIDLSYNYTPPASFGLPPELRAPTTINLTFNRHNLRTTLGAKFTLIPFVEVSADYSFGIQDNFTAGVGISF